MKSKLTNTHNETISLFVKTDEIEHLVSIPAGKFIIVDTYETKTIRIFLKRGFITMESLYESTNIAKDIVSEDISEIINPVEITVKSNDKNPSILEIVEGEVEQYIESGYVKGEWTDEDISYLKKNYPTKGRKFCSIHLNRNESSVQKKINALGLKKKKKK